MTITSLQKKNQEGEGNSIVFKYLSGDHSSLPVWRHIATSESFGQPVQIAASLRKDNIGEDGQNSDLILLFLAN